MQSNGVQFAPEQTLFIKAVPKGRVKFLEDAIISKCGAKAVNSVPDKDPLCHNAYLIYANYTSAGDAKRGQDKLERWLDDKWHFGNRPAVTIKGNKVKGPEVSYPPEQTLVLKPVSPERKEMLEDLIMKQSQPKNLHSVVDRDETIPGALLMYANYASVDETLRAQQRLEHWLDHNWEWNNRPLVAVKSAQQEVYFGMHVSGLPGDATTSDVEVFFSQFGTLHPFSKVHLLANKVGEAFVNFIDLESAELAIDASKNRTLTYGNSILIANAGRNMPLLQTRAVLAAGKHKHKTILCRYWQNGHCFSGENCNFAHGEHEVYNGSNGPSPQYANNGPHQYLSQESAPSLYLSQRENTEQVPTSLQQSHFLAQKHQQYDKKQKDDVKFMLGNGSLGMGSGGGGGRGGGSILDQKGYIGSNVGNMGNAGNISNIINFQSMAAGMHIRGAFGELSGTPTRDHFDNFGMGNYKSHMPSELGNFDSQKQSNFSTSHSNMNHDHERGDEYDMEDMSSCMMSMLLDDEKVELQDPDLQDTCLSAHAPTIRKTSKNVALMPLGGQRTNDFMLVQSWIQEIMNSDQGSFGVSAKFREEAIDVEALAELSENELIHYGVSKVGWRKKLMSRARSEHRRRHITTAKMPECCICLERPVSVAMVPCGHLCACEICAEQQGLNCPVCTQRTQSTLKIFLS